MAHKITVTNPNSVNVTDIVSMAPDFATLDGRTKRAKLVKNTYASIMSDLGGEDNASQNEREIARRMAFLAGLADEAEQVLAEYGFDDQELLKRYIEIGKAQATLASKLGMQRRAKEVEATHSLQQYLQTRPKSSPLD